MFKKAISLILSVSLILTQPVFAQGVAELNIGKYLNQMPVLNTDSFRPPRLRYISYDIKSNDFKLLLDQGDTKLSNPPNSSTPKLQDATQELFNYFLIGLSLPNDKFWVNLRPDAPEQIIDPLLEKTDMGKIMLEADLELKKDTAGLTSPQNPEGKEYWDKLYKKAGELFGTENITIPTITRPWIVPGEVIIRESEDSAYIYKANLKVMLEEDYISHQSSAFSFQQYTFSDPRMKELNKYSTELIKELILPKLTQEINTSKKYAQLRQVFFSLILSRWFKDKYKGKPGQYSSLIDSRNLDKITSKDPWVKDYYFNEYKKSFEQGEYNLKEQIPTPTGQVIRSYVSGGADWTNIASSSIRSNGYKFWEVAAITGVTLLSLWSLNYSSIQIKKETQKNYFAPEINVDRWTKLHEYLPNYDSIKGYYDKYKDSMPENGVSWLTPTDNDVVPWLTKIIMEEGNIFTIQFYKKPSIVDTLGLDSKVFFIKYRPSKVPLIEITGSFPDSIGSFPGNIGSGKYIKYLKGGIDNLRSVLGLPTETSSPLTQKEAKKGFNKSFGNLDRNYGDNSSADMKVKKYWKEMYPEYIPYVNYIVENERDLYDMKNRMDKLKQTIQIIEGELGKVKFTADLNEFWEGFKVWRDVVVRELRPQENNVSSSLSQEQKAPLNAGGIDFTRINYLTQPMGSFQGLDLRLPLLSKAELEGIDINKELASVEQMINARIDVSTDRLKRLLAAMSQKDAFTSQREIKLLPLLLRLCWLKEEKGTETTPDFRAVLLIADTGLFVEQGNTKYSLN